MRAPPKMSTTTRSAAPRSPAGSLVLGCATAFGELYRAGAIDRMPRILVSQPRNCCPLVAAIERGRDEVAERHWSTTVAEGTAIASAELVVELVHEVLFGGGP